MTDVIRLTVKFEYKAQRYLQLPLRQWGAGNFYLLVLSSLKVNIAENPIAVMGLYIRSGKECYGTYLWRVYDMFQPAKKTKVIMSNL